ncbi:hypothetical protein MNBD_DELTA01-1566 [hydrothermal vent metagenome]|uniref:Uncharacterized protein n=1 Tax=hydrothermal vent metagenome TaxID=652676 RepID=A0A3B0R443_9ZZZZ
MDKVLLLLIAITILTLIINLPFGYFRGNARKFSAKWFLYIHLPIPAIFVIRTFAGLGFKTVPIIVIGAIIGQIVGGRLYTAKQNG